MIILFCISYVQTDKNVLYRGQVSWPFPCVFKEKYLFIIISY